MVVLRAYDENISIRIHRMQCEISDLLTIYRYKE